MQGATKKSTLMIGKIAHSLTYEIKSYESDGSPNNSNLDPSPFNPFNTPYHKTPFIMRY